MCDNLQGKEKKAQASLEMSVAIAGVVVFFVAVINLFFWLNERLVLRQERYDGSRTTENQINENSLNGSLDLFR